MIMTMKNLSKTFSELYTPFKALLIYKGENGNTDQSQERADNLVYVEAYDINENGNPVNAHPLSAKETAGLAELLQSTQELKNDYLKSSGLLPSKVLYINPQGSGFAVWYTPPQETELFFIEKLGIPSGKAKIPAMVWKAGKNSLSVYAIKAGKKPVSNTRLFHAPFFNIYDNGEVCMGTVNVKIDRNCCLEDFMAEWENYFFNSYFSHLLADSSPVNGNIVQLWQEQVKTGSDFPVESLIKNNLTIQDLIK
jgi:PRTRC genetic system protein B